MRDVQHGHQLGRHGRQGDQQKHVEEVDLDLALATVRTDVLRVCVLVVSYLRTRLAISVITAQ